MFLASLLIQCVPPIFPSKEPTQGHGQGTVCSSPKEEGLKTGQNVWQCWHHLGGQSDSYNKKEVKVVTREAVPNVKSAFRQIVRPGEMSD